MEIPRDKFYVYTLARPDGSIFYIGKGRGQRIHAHENEARKGCTCPKCQAIQTLWKNGDTVIKSIVFVTTDESSALHHERQLIASTGRVDLHNRTNGGEGRSHASFDAMYQHYCKELRRFEREAMRCVGSERPRLLRLYEIRRKKLEEWRESHQRMIDIQMRDAIKHQRSYNSRWETTILSPWHSIDCENRNVASDVAQSGGSD